MNKLKLLIVIGVIVIVGIIIVVGFNNSTDKQIEKKEEVLQKVPNFELEDFDGNMVSLEDYKDRVVVLNSWATWCPFCVNELPDFKKLQEEFKDEISVIAINREESLNTSIQFTNENSLTNTYVFLLDPEDKFYRSIGGFTMPETLFVNTKGEIVIHRRGLLEFKEMKEIIEGILNKK